VPELYLQEQGTVTLYDGPWQIDVRKSELTLFLLYKKGSSEGQGIIEGGLNEKKASLIHLFWHITYAKADQKKWHFVSGERIYE
jgi:hypothetical protein